MKGICGDLGINPCPGHVPSKFLSALHSFCYFLSVGLLSYDSWLALLRLDCREKFERGVEDVELDRVKTGRSSMWATRGKRCWQYPEALGSVYVYVWYRTGPPYPSIIFSTRAVLESICYRTTANWLINYNNRTGGLKKVWTGCRGGSRDYLMN